MSGQNGTSSTPILVALVATGGLTLALVTYLLAKGGEMALSSSAVVVAFAATIVGPLVLTFQTRALQANVTAQVTKEATVTRESVAAVKEDVAVLAVQTDGKLNALMDAKEGRAAAEGELRGAAAEQDRVAALVVVAPVPIPVEVIPGAPQDVRVIQAPDQPVPVRLTKEEK